MMSRPRQRNRPISRGALEDVREIIADHLEDHAAIPPNQPSQIDWLRNISETLDTLMFLIADARPSRLNTGPK